MRQAKNTEAIGFQVSDPHCVQITPVDRVVSVDNMPGGTAVVTLAKTQLSLDGQSLSVVTVRLEWSRKLLVEACDIVRGKIERDCAERCNALSQEPANLLPA